MSLDRLATKADGEFRTVIAVIPSVGHFYCARERRQATAVGQERESLNPHDMSWLQLTWDGKFGDGGYVRCLHDAIGGGIGQGIRGGTSVQLVQCVDRNDSWCC
jgi:hypothetical protein